MKLIVKCKAIPVQAWTGPKGSRRLRLPDFKTLGTWRLLGCQSYAPAAFTTQEIFLVLTSVRGWAIVRPVGLYQWQWHPIGNRIRDLPACSAVPQPTAPPRAPKTYCTGWNCEAVILHHTCRTTVPAFINFRHWWRWVVSTMSQQFYPWGKNYLNPLLRQSRRGWGGENKNIYLGRLPNADFPVVQPVAQSFLHRRVHKTERSKAMSWNKSHFFPLWIICLLQLLWDVWKGTVNSSLQCLSKCSSRAL